MSATVQAPPVVLVFALSDPTGSTGVLADALTCAAMGCHAAGVVTAVSVQDSVRLEAVQAIDDEWVEDQARAVLQDMPVSAFKIGAVGSAENAQTIAEVLSDYGDVPTVLDLMVEVARSDDGDVGADAALELMVAARELLLPQTTVLTLDLALARRLVATAGEEEADEVRGADCARRLLEWGAEYVLLTGAEAVGNLNVNTLYGPEGSVQNESVERVDLRFRGAGDTLSAAIAALLAQGVAVADAVREAHEFLGQSLAAGFRLGMGAAMPDRLFWARDDVTSPDADDE